MSPKKLPNPYEAHPEREQFALNGYATPNDLERLLQRAADGYSQAAARARAGGLSVGELLDHLGDAFPAAEAARQLAAELAMERYGLTQRQVAHALRISHAAPYRWKHNPLRQQAIDDALSERPTGS